MTYSLTLELPEAVYKNLVEKAAKSGKPVEDIVLDRLTNDVESDLIDDSFEKFIGSLRSDVPDWADNHDKYIGESLYREMQGKTE